MRPIQTSFNAGKWSPLLEGRTDLKKYFSALYKCTNFLLDPRGPAILRPGFKYVAGTKTNSSQSVLIPFEFSVTQAYMLEFGNQYIRFYKDKEQILDGATAYEITSPYAEADLSEIKYTQSADVLYLFHKDYAPRKLSRTGHTSWTLSEINFDPPAISEQGIQPAATLTPGATTGNGITFTAGSSVFQNGDVGRTISSGVGRASIVSFVSGTQVSCDIIDDFTSTDPISSGSWTLNGSPDGDITPSDKGPVGKIITLTGSGDTESLTDLIDASDYWDASGSGTNEYYLNNSAPNYSGTKPDKVYINDTEVVEGSVGTLGISQWDWGDNDTLGYNTIYVRLSDGTDPDTKADDYVQRSTVSSGADLFRSGDVGKYIRVNSGLVKITSYTSATVVKGEVLKELSSTDESSSWTLENDVWNSTNGYPSCGTFFEDRLVLAGSTVYPETVWGSVVGDYENFTPGVDDSDSFEFTLAGRQVQVIRWIEPREYLLVGTVSGEWRLGPEDTGDPLTPLNVLAKEERNHGSANINPVTVTGSTLFVQRAARKIREFAYNFADDGFNAPDLTLLAEDITDGDIAGMVYQQEPISTVWCWLDDGSLISLSYLREQEVIGWCEHNVGGSVESMAVIPGTGYDEVWAVVNRTIGGSTVRYVEVLEKIFRDSPSTYSSNSGLNAFFVDSGITYNSTATTTITGLDHLEGETVFALADGALITGKTVSSGQITLPSSASVVHVGLFNQATLQMMRLDASLQNGTIQGIPKKIGDLTVRVVSSGAFKAGPDENNIDVVKDRNQTVVLGGAYPLYTGDLDMGYDGGWEKDARPMIVQDKPLPLTVAAIMMDVDL